jgi:hypothetical protein
VRVEVLHTRLDGLLALSATGVFVHSDHPGGGAGMLLQGYGGKNAEHEVWEFDAALMRRSSTPLRQAAIEVRQWTEQRQLSSEAGTTDIARRLNAERIDAPRRSGRGGAGCGGRSN